MSRILITPRSLTAAPGNLLVPLEAAGFELIYSPPGRQPKESELLGLVPGCVGWLAGVEPISARVLDAADELRVIARNGVGIDSIDLAAARRRGVEVLTAPGANASSVAELTIGLMIAGLRGIPASVAALKQGAWQREQGREISGCTIGLIGCGAVGRAVAQAALSLGAGVVAYDPKPALDFRPSPRFSWAPLDQVLAAADVVSLHCPAQPDGTAIITQSRVRQMRAGAGLVNTARASLIEEDALLAALDARHLGWYATDVFDVEPPPLSRLISHERVIATPHIGGLTAEGGRRAVQAAVENLLTRLPRANLKREAATR